MGYSTDINARLESLDLVQTPRSVAEVRLRAGYTASECGVACGIHSGDIVKAESGIEPLSKADWRNMLMICGQRVFDFEKSARGG